MTKNIQSILIITLFMIGFTANSQTRYLDDVFPSVTVNSNITYATNISILPMIQSLPPSPAPKQIDIYQPTGNTQSFYYQRLH